LDAGCAVLSGTLARRNPVRVEALREPQIAAAIRLIHAKPERPWTVAELAAGVAYSRSAFASRFVELVGETPIAYLTRSRLARAATQLDRTSMSIGEIARRAGYANEASFGRVVHDRGASCVRCKPTKCRKQDRPQRRYSSLDDD
jgi:transcriptional regulator GlxA family with amidase domain